MERFSVRNGYKIFENMESCQLSTRKRIWQVFARKVFLSDKQHETKYDIVEDILSYFGQSYDYSNHFQDHINNCNELEIFISQEAEWYQVYDFIEYHLYCSKDEDKDLLTSAYNEVLEDEKTGYRIIDGYIVPITNESEIEQVEKALKNSPEHVAMSLNKSLKLFSERNNPDYNNVVKESITAVESLCCTIVDGEENTLGKAMDKFNSKGLELNEHFRKAIKELYWYSCDVARHGGTSYKVQSMEDAKFMIVTCSTIINHLMIKWDKKEEGKK